LNLELKVFMFATDKTPGFSMVDLKVSPTKHHHLVIGALQPNHIEETFNLSETKDGKSLSVFIKFGSDTIRSEFFRRLYAATGGLPRCIHYALEALCIEGTIQVNSPEDIAQALDLGYSREYEQPLRCSTNPHLGHRLLQCLCQSPWLCCLESPTQER
jgi:hypothetical protein